MTAARSACALTKHADQLVSEILSDATVERDIVQIEKGGTFKDVFQKPIFLKF